MGGEREREKIAFAEGLGGFPLLFVVVVVAAGNGDAQAGKGLVPRLACVFPDSGLDLASGDGNIEREFGFGFSCRHGLLLVSDGCWLSPRWTRPEKMDKPIAWLEKPDASAFQLRLCRSDGQQVLELHDFQCGSIGVESLAVLGDVSVRRQE